jgi:hypothetical protein
VAATLFLLFISFTAETLLAFIFVSPVTARLFVFGSTESERSADGTCKPCLERWFSAQNFYCDSV